MHNLIIYLIALYPDFNSHCQQTLSKIILYPAWIKPVKFISGDREKVYTSSKLISHTIIMYTGDRWSVEE